MTGLVLLGVAVTWIVFASFISVLVYRRLPKRAWRGPVVVMLLLGHLLLPLSDEIVGRQQFEALCEKHSRQSIDEKARGKSVRFVQRSKDEHIGGTAIRIRIDPHEYRDAETNKVLVSYHTLHADGGWLIRTLGISERNRPLLFRSSCGLSAQDEFSKRFDIKVLNEAR